ncbi:hypothetical protein [Dickeya fangzhongdai]|uniref:hypothetical protein n=1 Tax=Dickeya fangzhongdai TaxID=1778540 RepID=UPI0011AB8A15|nr:hypothetical protein [Dickeya fangzhongdai]MBO8135939.1 hypothetical protein [Dickeya fangzhongdai]WOY02087.1 hypothetical protein OGM22_09945 [Dickeya fangzhongdai]WOY02717.1 hypothetical protein OGM21_12455 [Dickeya fangzhongdai]GGC18480.1 hypothetical protein GCM10007171_39810 [Dickeya fangzhongdai]
MNKLFISSCIMIFSTFIGSTYAGVTVEQAIRDGCYTSDQVRDLIEIGEKNKPMGTVTLNKAKANLTSSEDRSITRTKVTAPETWVYRGYEDADNWHTNELLYGVIYSKGQNARDKAIRRGISESDFWSKNGPQLELKHPGTDMSPSESTYFMMRLLSIKTSDTPPSQFVSFALNYKLASEFGEVVYALQVNPDSPILGLRNCTLNGEYQFQILGGTRFNTLYKKHRGKEWQRYNRDANTWQSVPKGTVPE